MVEPPNVAVQTGKQHTVNSFIVVGVYYWNTVEWKELLPDSSLSHLRGMETFLKAQCFTLLPRCPFGFWVFRLWLFCVLLSYFLCLLVTPGYLSRLFSHTWE